MYTSITPAFRAAAEIEQITADTISFVEARLKQLHELAADPAVLDVFGKNAVAALTAYRAFHSALTVAKFDHTAPAFDISIYQPQPDGSVKYIAPTVELDQPADEPA
jgi:hypothetical protein